MELRACYRTLGLSPGASLKAIKSAYRKLARRWHPDRFPEDPAQQQAAAERFKSINAAYDCLCAASERERAAVRPADEDSSPTRRPQATGRPPVARYGRRGQEEPVRQSQKVPARRRYQRVDASVGRPPHEPATRTTARATGTVVQPSEPRHAASGRPTGWGAIVLVAGAVGAFCLGLLYSTTLGGMLAWTATWAVLAAGAFVRLRAADA